MTRSLDTELPRLPSLLLETIVRRALEEDLGGRGDVTTDAIVPTGDRAVGTVVARAAGRVAGVDATLTAFRILDPDLVARVEIHDGEDVDTGGKILEIEGRAGALLTAERVALNLLGRACGVATATRALVDAVTSSGTRIVGTRKTLPGLRLLDKHAVRCGGGSSHRFGLNDAVLIKDNHVEIAGSVGEAVERARSRAGHMLRIEVEVDTLEQLDEALDAGAQAILLDNMDVDTLRLAVARIGGRAIAEASGGVTLETVAAIAATGVDLISVGAITHSAPTLDVSLELRRA